MMIPTVDHGLTLLMTIEMVQAKEREVINQGMLQFGFLVSELTEVKVCEPFASQFRKDQGHFQDIRQLRS
jgi:hypothetical protein